MKGLYAITPEVSSTDALLRLAAQALDGGVTLLQYRNKLADAELRREQASALLKMARAKRTADRE